MKASFSFVPTPSAELTRTGFLYPESSKPAPKLPIPVRTPLVIVSWASFLIRETARSASSISTPASLYRTGLRGGIILTDYAKCSTRREMRHLNRWYYQLVEIDHLTGLHRVHRN